jgi:L-ascorbate metabolism protein UlaG (beta-lactamase superfamily)
MPDAEPTVIALAPAAGKRANETTAAADMNARYRRMEATSEVVVLRHLGPVAEVAQRIQQSNLNSDEPHVDLQPEKPARLISMTHGTSDHFDGKRFFNPTLSGDFAPTLGNLFKMLREPRSRWPRFVDNKVVPQLDVTLGMGDIAVTFVNHATFLIQLCGITILTDPIWSERASPVTWAGPRRVRRPGVAFDDLPKIDVVLLSHNHYDHLDLPTLRRLRQTSPPIVLVAAGDGRLVGPLGFEDMRELDWWDETPIGDALKITFVPAQHSSARGLFDRHRSLWGGYVMESLGRRVYFGGDSGYSKHFSDIKLRLGTPDIAMLGIGAYEPRWFMKPIHMNPAEAIRAHGDLGAKISIGMHFGTFQLTPEPIDQPLIDLRAALAQSGIPDREFVTLHEGETQVYKAQAV